MICCISWFFKILNIVFCDLYTQNSMVQTNRSERVKPSTTRWERDIPTTNRGERIKPTTDRWERDAVSSSRDPRNQLVNFFAKLRDEDNIVCNESWKIIYIYANEWEPIPMTQWQDR